VAKLSAVQCHAKLVTSTWAKIIVRRKLAQKAHTYKIFKLIEISNVIVNYCQTVVLDMKCPKCIEMKQCYRQWLQKVMTTQFIQSTALWQNIQQWVQATTTHIEFHSTMLSKFINSKQLQVKNLHDVITSPLVVHFCSRFSFHIITSKF